MLQPEHLTPARLAPLLTVALAPLGVGLYRPEAPDASISAMPGEEDTREAGYWCVGVILTFPPPVPHPVDQLRVISRDSADGVDLAVKRIRAGCEKHLRRSGRTP